MKTTTTLVIDALTESFYAVRGMNAADVRFNIGTLFPGVQSTDMKIRYIETEHEGMISLIIKTLKADGFSCKNGEVVMQCKTIYGANRITMPSMHKSVHI